MSVKTARRYYFTLTEVAGVSKACSMTGVGEGEDIEESDPQTLLVGV